MNTENMNIDIAVRQDAIEEAEAQIKAVIRRQKIEQEKLDLVKKMNFSFCSFYFNLIYSEIKTAKENKCNSISVFDMNADLGSDIGLLIECFEQLGYTCIKSASADVVDITWINKEVKQ